MTKRLTIALIALAVVLLFVALPVSARVQISIANISTPGANVFIGEQGLNLTSAQLKVDPTGTSTTIGWYASAAVINTTPPTKTISILGRNNSFMVTPSDFVGYTGNWYMIQAGTGYIYNQALINVNDPTMDVRIWDSSYLASQSGQDVTGGSVIQGDILQFRVDTNIYSAYNGARSDTNRDANGIPLLAAPMGNTVPGIDVNNGTTKDGYIDIKVKPASGNTLTAIWNSSYAGGAITNYLSPLTSLNVTYQPWFWGLAAGTGVTYNGVVPTALPGNWSTGAIDQTGQQAYPAGTYTVTATSYLNAMYDNYLNGGAYYTDKTVSEARTVTLASNTVSITANQDTVVRSKAFSVTITGRPNTVYHLWLKDSSSMDGTYDNQPPVIAQSQAGVVFDNIVPATGVPDLSIPPNAGNNFMSDGGNYTWQNGGGTTIYSDVAHGLRFGAPLVNQPDTATALGNGTYLYANVTLDQTGSRTVGWATTNWTKAQQYTIRVEQNFGGANGFKSDEVKVTVQKGAVTIVAAGDQSYYLGEEVDFSGTNTESTTTNLFIIGPNLPTNGAQIAQLNPRAFPVTDGQASTFQQAAVLGDNTWSWNWGTATVALDAGTYTVYAVSQPEGVDQLTNTAYGTVSIILKKPFVSATASQSTVAQGDELIVSGTAEGQPTVGVQLWVLGKNYAYITTESVNSDSSFSHTFKRTDTLNLASGQYFLVVQHPMQNDRFDIIPYPSQTTPTYVINLQSPQAVSASNPSGYQQMFTLSGSGSLQGSDAAEALVEAINSPNVDDTYTKLQFLVEVPVITLDPIGDHHVGDQFTITGTTNLAVGDDVLFEVYSSSFTPTQKSQSGAFSGATGTVQVTAGTGGLNALSFPIDASTFKPDEYLAKATEVLQPQASGTALFNVLEGAAPTAAPTAAVVTTAAPTMAATVPPTPVATTVVPTPTKTPGFGAIVALIGLGAVAFVIVRRH